MQLLKKKARGTVLRVLVVDDEKLLLGRMVSLLGKILSPTDELGSFSTAGDALAWAESRPVDVAFLDIELKEETNGVALAEQLQKLHPRLNVIFCTGYTQYAMDAIGVRCSGYLLKPPTAEAISKALENLRYPVAAAAKRVQVRCLGNFDIQVDGTPVKFKYEKTKEVLAVLVDKMGEYVSNSFLEQTIWENVGHINYLKSLRLDLTQTLSSLGCADIIATKSGNIAIVPEAIDCDYYNLVNGKTTQRVHLQEYMSQYSWADRTGKALHL